ncbi:MAG TPA: hypothetical protein VIG30_18415, partial [Ktedonobacterales bacterium]
MDTTTGLPRRNEVPTEQTWDETDAYPSDEAWREALRAANAEVPSLARFRGRLGESAATLLQALRLRDEWQALIWRIRWHAAMRVKVDATDQRAAAQHEEAMGLIARAGAAFAYFDPELLRLDPGQFQTMCHELPALAR